MKSILILFMLKTSFTFGQIELFDQVNFNDTLKRDGLSFIKQKDSLVRSMILYKYSILFEDSDSLIGYWGIKNDTIYYISEADVIQNCDALTPMFVLSDNPNKFLFIYSKGCKQKGLMNYSIVSHLISITRTDRDLIYNFQQTLNNETIPIDNGGSMKYSRFFSFSLSNGFIHFSESKNCESCEFPY